MEITDWKTFFANENTKLYFSNLLKKIDNAYDTFDVFPEKKDLWKAFELVPLKDVKVVIIGQDPYHEQGQAMGMAFSVPKGIKLPPSLRNIYKEIENDIVTKMNYNDGDLTYLARQGVLLLNTVLTVKNGEAFSLAFPEYEQLMKAIITTISSCNVSTVYLLWGKKAQYYARFVTNPNHLVLLSNHPSPLSANRGGFFNQQHFSQTNEYLLARGLVPIHWQNK